MEKKVEGMKKAKAASYVLKTRGSGGKEEKEEMCEDEESSFSSLFFKK